VVEDVTDLVLNLKKILIVSQKREPVRLTIKASREGPVTAADIQPDPAIQVINPDQLICTLDKARAFDAEIEIKTGRGYCPGEANKKEDQAIGVIPIDSLFSPVRLVRYTVDNTRVGQITDYDKLVLESGPTVASRPTTPSNSPPRSSSATSTSSIASARNTTNSRASRAPSAKRRTSSASCSTCRSTRSSSPSAQPTA